MSIKLFHLILIAVKSLTKSSVYLVLYFFTFLRYRFFLPRSTFLEIGSGPKGKNLPDRLTLDQCLNCDIVWDLRLGIPLPSNSIIKIYSSHLFEHIPFSAHQSVIAECLRVLKPGGEFSISVPNSRLYFNAYSSNEYFKSIDQSWRSAWPNNSCLIDQINYIAYMGDAHKYMFDEQNLLSMLNKSALIDCKIRFYQDAIDPPKREYESIYAVGYKPLHS